MTWHSSGLVGAFKPSYSQVLLAQQTIKLYEELTAKGLKTGWKQCGSLNVARTRDRMTQFRRMKALSHLWGIECDILTAAQCKEKCPIMETDDLLGGIWIPKDGVAHPKYICDALITQACEMGVTVIEKCTVKEVAQQQSLISSVRTNLGRVNCAYFVNCAGFWARSIGEMSEPSVKIPLQPAEHHFLHTKPIANLDPMMPVIRDLDGQIYIREVDGRILAGGFDEKTKPAFQNVTIPCELIAIHGQIQMKDKN